MNYTLYTTHCPRCEILRQKLDDLGIKYNVVENVDEMLKKGFEEVPQLEYVDNFGDTWIYSFAQAIKHLTYLKRG